MMECRIVLNYIWGWVNSSDNWALMANIATVFAFIIAFVAFFRWKIVHIKERKSNDFMDVKNDIYSLRFLLHELRRVQMLPCNPREINNKHEFFREIKLPIIKKIQEINITILQKLCRLEELLEKKLSENGSILSLYQKNIHDTLISEMFKRYYFYDDKNSDGQFERAVEFFFPSESKALNYEEITTNEIGQNIINDKFEKKSKEAFDNVFTAINKKIL